MKMKYMLVPLLLTAAAFVPLKPAVRAQEAPRRIEITAKQFTFEPAEITVKKGEPVVPGPQERRRRAWAAFPRPQSECKDRQGCNSRASVHT